MAKGKDQEKVIAIRKKLMSWWQRAKVQSEWEEI